MNRKHRHMDKEEKKKRSVPFLPNFITTMSLFCGFYSISFSLKGNFYMAAVLILIAGIIDGLDGRVARATNSTSAFGKEYDSLSDLVAFGVSPAIMAFLWQVNQFGRLGFIAAFLFVACGALRLARFNTDDSNDGSNFTGLPIPMTWSSPPWTPAGPIRSSSTGPWRSPSPPAPPPSTYRTRWVTPRQTSSRR
jgi:CDP-diacylglycerol---serine O-phosphatidyltransferase